MCPSVNCSLTAPMGEISTFGSGSFIVVLSPNIHPRWQSSANSDSSEGPVLLNSNRSRGELDILALAFLGRT